MAGMILVMGATGTVGGATLHALRVAGTEPVAVVRDPERARRILGSHTPLRTGDLADEASLRVAFKGAESLLLCSGHDPAMRECQLAAVRAIASSEIRRVVKISGSPVSVTADSPARSGRDHFAVEEALRRTGREIVAVRPNAFMQTFLDQGALVANGILPGPESDPRVSFVDARDIGRVAAAALLAVRPTEPVLEVTGPAALTWPDVAAAMSAVFGRPVSYFPAAPDLVRQALDGMGRPEWLVEHTLELSELMREPRAAEVTDTVERMTGRQATPLAEFLTDHATAFQPQPEQS
jgi:uncharacterized protein YbjT (DUF2867 family)